MRKPTVLVMTTLTLSLLGVSISPGPPVASAAAGARPRQNPATAIRVARYFEGNSGQFDAATRFVSKGGGFALALTDEGAVLLPSGSGDTIRLQLVGASAAATPQGREALAGRTNYFFGRDPKRWVTNVPTYGSVEYPSVYRGIDLVYYGKERHLEYDFIVAPGADPQAIALTVDAPIRINSSGDAIVSSKTGDVRFHKPVIYQPGAAGERQTIDGQFVIEAEHTLRFTIGKYDPTKTLVIDPVLEYSTYLGGNNIEEAQGFAVDGSRNVYITATTTSSDFPLASALDPTPQGNVVTKIDAGGALVYSTYFGGGACGSINGFPIACDQVTGLGVDVQGNAYVTGFTESTDFPVIHAYQASFHGVADAFVTKISPDGAALVYSTYLGGAALDKGLAIAVDALGNAFVAGDTESTDFPTHRAFQSSLTPGISSNDNFVAHFLPDGQTLDYSSYLGGSQDDQVRAVATDGEGSVYVTGITVSPDFPTHNGFQTSVIGSYDAFVAKINTSREGDDSFEYGTLLGGGSLDEPHSIAVDSLGRVWVVGETPSPNFPVKNPLQASFNGGGRDAFVSYLSTTATGSDSLIFSSYFGGSGGDVARGVAISPGATWITGHTNSADLALSVNALKTIYDGHGEAFVAKIAADSEGGELLYSSYFGGDSDTESGQMVASLGLSRREGWVAGFTWAADFPTTPNAVQRTIGLGTDLFVAKFLFTPDLALSAIPPVTIPVGGSGTVTATVTSLDEWDDLVKLSVSGQPAGGPLPQGLTADFAHLGDHAAGNAFDPPINGAASSTLTIGVGPFVTPATYTLWLTIDALHPVHQTPIVVTTVATIAGTSAAISSMYGAGCIDNGGIANALTSKLTNAQEAIDRGDTRSAINTHGALLNQIRAQSGKHIGTSCTIGTNSFDPTVVLTNHVRSLIASLKVSAAANPVMGYVVTDANAAIEGATLSLVDASSHVVASVTSDAAGFYYFPMTGSLTPGSTYTVTVSVPVRFTTATPSTQSFRWGGASVTLGDFVLR